MFSIVIPLHNKAHIVMRTLASVLSQTYPIYEVIIIDDGSTDNSLEVVENFVIDVRFKIIKQNNQGVSAARNKGVANAKYEHIAFLDADDELLPGYLSKMKEAIELFPTAGIYGCSSWHINILTGDAGNTTLNRYKNKIKIVEYFENPHTMPHTSAMVVSRTIFNKVFQDGNGFPFSMKCCEDWSCFFQIALQFDFVYIGFPLGIRNNNVSGQITAVNQKDRFTLFKHVIDYYNLVFNSYSKTVVKNKYYLVFLLYELRVRILSCLIDNDYLKIEYFFKGLSPEILALLNKCELIIYTKPKLNLFGRLYIYGTKILWRTNGFPVVGKK